MNFYHARIKPIARIAALLPASLSAAILIAACATPKPDGPQRWLASVPGEKVLWDSWYTVTIGKKMHYGYYNDKATIRQGKVTFQNQFWKQEEGFVNEERLGAIAEDNAELTPVFFNFRSSYRSVETNIDGSVNPSNRVLTIKITKGGKEQPPILKSLPKGLFVSSLFPVWVSRRLGTLKPGQSQSFLTLMEDNLDNGFQTVTGSVKAEPADEFARKSRTQKLTVNYQDRKSVWYIEPSGNPVRIEMPEQNTLVERVSREDARNFLAQ